MTPEQRARSVLDRAESRGAIKRLGDEVDRDEELRLALVALAAARGAEVDPGWPGKKLIRAALDRGESAQVRKNPIHRDEAFVCAHCGFAAPPHGRTARDHCPKCLRSLHVDVIPGDRAADCGGVLDPVGLEIRGATTVILYRCRTCAAEKRNQALLDGEVPDDPAALVRVSRGER